MGKLDHTSARYSLHNAYRYFMFYDNNTYPMMISSLTTLVWSRLRGRAACSFVVGSAGAFQCFVALLYTHG